MKVWTMWIKKILRTMIEMYGGGPVGLGTLSVNIAEERETVEDMYEPYLIQKGFIMRTRSGRVATAKAYEHLGYEYSENEQEILEAVRKNPDMMATLTIIRDFGLKDSWLAAGSIRNIWIKENHIYICFTSKGDLSDKRFQMKFLTEPAVNHESFRPRFRIVSRIAIISGFSLKASRISCSFFTIFIT